MSQEKLGKTGKVAFQLMAILVVFVSSALWIGRTKATAQELLGPGVAAQLIESENLPESVLVKTINGSNTNLDVTQIRTYKITISPGGYTGWHQHGGPSTMIIASGALTYYDTSCAGVVYSPGRSILDPGSDTHVLKNEGHVDVVAYLTVMLPAGGTLQIEVPVLTNFCDWHGPARTRHQPN